MNITLEEIRENLRGHVPMMAPVYYMQLEDLERNLKEFPHLVSGYSLLVSLAYCEEFEKFEHAKLLQDEIKRRESSGASLKSVKIPRSVNPMLTYEDEGMKKEDIEKPKDGKNYDDLLNDFYEQ